MPHCAKCHNELTDFGPGQVVGRTATCPKCLSDLHSCIQCRHYDLSAYNSCREPAAERVVDKERANFCELFAIAIEKTAGSANDEKSAALKQLDELFK